MKERTFEVKVREDDRRVPSFYAQSHCVCGSTLGSGEWWPSVRRAVDEARENIESHEVSCAKRAMMLTEGDLIAEDKDDEDDPIVTIAPEGAGKVKAL